MALKFFWRCESATLDSTHDYSAAGALTMQANSLVELSSGGARVGTNGLRAVSGNDFYSQAGTNLISGSAGAVAFSLKPVGTMTDSTIIFLATFSGGYIRLNTTNTDELIFNYTISGWGSATAVTTSVNLTNGNWYGVVLRWNAAGSGRIEVYNSSGTLIQGVDTSTTISGIGGSIGTPSASTNDGLCFGSQDTNMTLDIDNIFIADSYSEPLESKLTIASYTEYAGDSTAPVLTSPTGTATGTTTATVGATTDEGNGTLYAVVTTSATQPSVAQIKAAQDHTGASAPWGSSVAVSSTGAKTLNATGLTAATTYYAHLVHTDSSNNNSNVISSSSFTTPVRKLKLRLASSSAGATGVEGVVWAVQAGGIVGAEIGEFTGQTIATGTGADSGYAVLKVPVADFGGGSLNVNDQVKVFVRNTTNFSDIWTGTIIEE